MKESVVLLYNNLDDPGQKQEQDRDVNLIDEALSENGYNVIRIAVSANVSRLMLQIKEISPQYIFNLCEEVDNDSRGEIYIASMMELMHIPYTGSRPSCLSLALNKARTKDVLLSHGIAVPKYQVFNSENVKPDNDLKFPLIIKPLTEDGSFGIELDSVVFNSKEFLDRVLIRLKEFICPVIAEEYIQGRELNIAILENDKGINPLPVSELDYSNMPEGYPKICSYRGKWDSNSVDYKGTVPVCPANVSGELHRRLNDIALRAYELMGCRDYARVDFRVNKDNVPYIIDINPNPCISPDSGFVRSAKAAGYTYKSMINTILNNCKKRKMTERTIPSKSEQAGNVII